MIVKFGDALKALYGIVSEHIYSASMHAGTELSVFYLMHMIRLLQELLGNIIKRSFVITGRPTYDHFDHRETSP
jgi:hypothetical protein